MERWELDECLEGYVEKLYNALILIANRLEELQEILTDKD